MQTYIEMQTCFSFLRRGYISAANHFLFCGSNRNTHSLFNNIYKNMLRLENKIEMDLPTSKTSNL